MPQNLSLITTLAAAFGFALFMGFIAARLKLPPLLGYLVAGILLGPATPGYIADIELSRQLAEVGVMLLMFGVGLHFSFEDLMAVRRFALPGALVQMTVATMLGAAAALLWGWNLGAGVVFGLALAVTSTVALTRSLENRGLLKSINGHIAVGWLVVQDLVVALVLVLLPALAGWLTGGADADVADRVLPMAVAITLGEVLVFVLLMIVVGKRVFPWVLWHVARTGSRELFTLCVIAAAVGIAYGAAAIFDVSFALGAFISGMVLRESALSHRAANESLPLRDAFAVLFFVSVGMLFDPAMLIREPARVLIVIAIIMLGNSLTTFLLALAFRYPLNTALTLAMGLAQIGEFSFILASLGVSLQLLPVDGQNLILAGALFSIALNPLLCDAIEPLQAWIRSRSRLARAVERPDDPLAELPLSIDQRRLTGHVVVVGYGRVGQRIVDALVARDVSIVVVEQNRDLVELLRERGIPAVSGDASDPPVIIQAHIARARMLVIAVPDIFRARKMLEIARMLKPDINSVVRAHSDEEAALLQADGAGQVFMGEHELALGMTRHILDQVGGTADMTSEG
jgi:CPA2 family monovalent cation:H+ antiporter-2